MEKRNRKLSLVEKELKNKNEMDKGRKIMIGQKRQWWGKMKEQKLVGAKLKKEKDWGKN